MKKYAVWSVMTALSAGSAGIADTIYPQNNGFELANQVAANRITYVSQTDTVRSPGWTLYGGGAGSNRVAVTCNGWVGLGGLTNNITNGNSDGTTSTYGQAMQIRGGDGKYGTNATVNSAYISTTFTLAQRYTNVTVQFDYRSRVSAANKIDVYIVDSNNTAFYLGGKQQCTQAMVNFSTTNSVSLGAGTYKLYLVGAVNNDAYTALVDNVQINAEPENMVILGFSGGSLNAARPVPAEIKSFL
jgi:hypothetical protein